MKSITVAAMMVLMSYMVLTRQPVNAASNLPTPEQAKQILDQMDFQMRGNSQITELTMKVHTRSWERDYSYKLWTKGNSQTFVRVMGPVKVAGQAYLRLATRLWNYLPDLERSILLPSSLMTDRFMGSDFSNDDLVKMSRFARDYDAKILGQEVINGVNTYHMELKPHSDAPVSYSKLEVWVRCNNPAPVKIQFFNSQLEVMRTLSYSVFQTFSGHNIPTIWEMQNAKEPDRNTIITVKQTVFDTNIPDSIFTRDNLTR